MVKIRHLKAAPIIEAIIDIRTRLPKHVDFDSHYSELKKELSTKFKKIEKAKLAAGSIEIKDGKPIIGSKKNTETNGYRFTSKTTKEVVQFRKDGFTYSKLKPYTDWISVKREATALWDLYKTMFRPELVEKISLEYINRIDLPASCDLEIYFTAAPKLPKSLPQTLNYFYYQMLVEEKDLKVDITQTPIPINKEDYFGYILDIDVFKKDEKGIDEQTIWQNFNKMRALKNKIFFKFIKDEAVVMFE